MNLAQAALQRAQTVLTTLGPGADVVTFNGQKYCVTINRNVAPSPETEGKVSSSTREGSVIEFPVGVTSPEIGDVLVDSLGISHKVLRPVLHIGHAIKLTCEVLR